jgi:class 3 adenylate cyclase/tetratricopeptide (TPR) repeat protein
MARRFSRLMCITEQKQQTQVERHVVTQGLALEHGELVTMLASYVPDVILRRLARDPRPLREPLAERLSGAALVADVSGFTAFTESLAKEGAIGAEKLNAILNDYFGLAIAVISAHGGDVVRFAGDAVLAAWYADSAHAVADVAASAARCALALQTELHGYRTSDGSPFSLKVGIGAGEFVIMHIGGVRDRWEFLVSGPAFVQAFTALEKAAPEQAVVSLRAWSHINTQFTGRQLTMGLVLVESAHTMAEPAGARLPQVAGTMAPALHGYIPATVTSRLSAGQENWLGELRVANVLFVNLPELNYATPLDRAQQIMRDLQVEIYRFEGNIDKLNVDDKGTSLVAAMGLPPLAHDDDPKRAVQAAMAILRKLGELGLRSSIGISTGRVFCGSIGSPRRREYTLLGDAVNIAARLMQAALGDILCDEATYHMARSHIEFERFTEIVVKGRQEPVAVYRPMDSGRPPASVKCELIGRQRERDLIAARLHALMAGAEVAAVILEGEAGIGKSRLVADVLDRARAFGVTPLVGGGDSVEATTLYYAWRPIFHQLLGLDETDRQPEARRRHILAQLEPRPELFRLAPLLEAVLPCGLGDNEVTAAMTGQVRGDNTRALLVGLLGMAASQSPTLVVLEDAHWQDSAAWALTSLVSRQLPSVLLLLSTRPFTQNSPAEYSQVLRAPNTMYLRLDKLALQDTAQLLSQCLGVASVPDNVVTLVHEKAEGNPLFAEELAYALRDGGLLRIEEGQSRLVAESPDWSRLGLPDTLHGVIASRIDRLGTPQQLAVKVASVIGHHFHFRALHDNYPLEGEKPWLRDHLAIAQDAEILGIEVPEPEAVYLFRHVIIQQVAYELLLFQQRQQLHHAVAEWYEKSYAVSLAQHYPFLAHHWRHAGEAAKAVDYLEKAGEQSLCSGGYSEAAGFFREALGLDAEAGLQTRAFRRARWERQLGEAYLGLGRLSESREHLERALKLLGRPTPATPGSLRASLLGHAARQLLRRAGFVVRALVRRFVVPPSAGSRPAAKHGGQPADGGTKEQAETAIEAARAYERLVEIYYLSSEKPRLLHAILATLNLTETAGPSPELAKAYATNSFAAGLLGLHRLARSYRGQALETIGIVRDPVATAWVWGAIGISHIGMGETGDARKSLQQAVAIHRELGDWQHWGESMAMLAQANYCAGDFRRGLQLWTEVYATARSRGDRLQQAWGLNGQAEGILRTGGTEQAEEAVSLVRTALGLFAENTDKISRLGSCGLLATAYLRCREMQSARQAADDGQRLIEELSSPTAYYMLGGYAGVASTYLALWEVGCLERHEAVAAAACEACRALHRYARTFPVGAPIADLCCGRALWIKGKHRAAMKAWSHCLRVAAQLNMPYEQGLAHLEIGQRLPAGHPERREHLARACELFVATDTSFDLGRARQLLSD